MRRLAMAVLFSVSLLAPRVASAGPEEDPLGIAGTWDYETRSNCGPVVGVGAVSFRYRAARGGYDERGHVFWSHSRQTIRWWGPVRWDAARRRIVGRIRNSLDDTVHADWRIEGEPPERLVVEWSQSNGCHGTGVARRRR